MAPKSKTVTYGWIWPKDPRRGNPNHWPRHWRLKDILTNKGPDIYIGSIKSYKPNLSPSATAGENTIATAPKKTNWSRWEEQENKHKAIPWARRSTDERYDFRTRKYAIPDEGTWSQVQYCSNRFHDVPRMYWDQYGNQYPAEFWHDSQYGPHRDM
ncbi:hypothetical protein N7495_006960 [Penicillium taxi]|uniref:uncharacterized protein n=1 Tax=Penicillium taxi TaxID=168475 RepID=UPI0025454E8D|nr:uncharacterized protein N7495_006960 [Penicillium taxi]KAJ5895269.1 hypothetical protein N7495_006960 [Penicillium taxi]